MYGGAGITLSEEFKDFQVFFDYCISHGWKEVLQIDRIDNSKGYEKGNIRFVTAARNSQNRKMHSTNTSGYRGVGFHKASNKWQSRCEINGKRENIGLFSTAVEAAISWDMFVLKNRDFNSHPLNFPELEFSHGNIFGEKAIAKSGLGDALNKFASRVK